MLTACYVTIVSTTLAEEITCMVIHDRCVKLHLHAPIFARFSAENCKEKRQNIKNKERKRKKNRAIIGACKCSLRKILSRWKIPRQNANIFTLQQRVQKERSFSSVISKPARSLNRVEIDYTK